MPSAEKPDSPSAPQSAPASGARTPQQRERRLFWWVGGLTILLAAAGGVAGVLVAESEGPGGGLSTVGVLVLVAVLLGGVLLVGGLTLVFFVWRRRRGSAVFARSPLWELPTQRERRALVRDLRRGTPIGPHRHDLALRTARDLAGRGRLMWLYVALAVVQFGNFFLQDGGIRWLYLVAGAAALAAAVVFSWQVRRMRQAAARLEHIDLERSDIGHDNDGHDNGGHDNGGQGDGGQGDLSQEPG